MNHCHELSIDDHCSICKEKMNNMEDNITIDIDKPALKCHKTGKKCHGFHKVTFDISRDMFYHCKKCVDSSGCRYGQPDGPDDYIKDCECILEYDPECNFD